LKYQKLLFYAWLLVQFASKKINLNLNAVTWNH
jgi:hypothetical protein